MKVKFIIISPKNLSGKEGEVVTLYKNLKNLYVAILRGMEIGLASTVENIGDDTKNINLPTCIEGKLEKDFNETKSLIIIATI